VILGDFIHPAAPPAVNYVQHPGHSQVFVSANVTVPNVDYSPLVSGVQRKGSNKSILRGSVRRLIVTTLHVPRVAMEDHRCAKRPTSFNKSVWSWESPCSSLSLSLPGKFGNTATLNRFANGKGATGTDRNIPARVRQVLPHPCEALLLGGVLLGFGLLDRADENSTVRENNHFLHTAIIAR
jgi:hypothetical protein